MNTIQIITIGLLLAALGSAAWAVSSVFKIKQQADEFWQRVKELDTEMWQRLGEPDGQSMLRTALTLEVDVEQFACRNFYLEGHKEYNDNTLIEHRKRMDKLSSAMKLAGLALVLSICTLAVLFLFVF